MQTRDIIAAFGGYEQLARDVGVVRSATANWLRKGIPTGRCLQLAELARAKGLDQDGAQDGQARPAITLETLMRSAAEHIARRGEAQPMKGA